MKILNPIDVEFIVVHASDTFADMDLDISTVKQWHTSPDPKDPSKPWADVGYHYFLKRNGLRQYGRDIKFQGSHVKGFNFKSVAVCMAGGKSKTGAAEFNFTSAQITALTTLVSELKAKFPQAKVVGHRDLFPGKACPCFDVKAFFQ